MTVQNYYVDSSAGVPSGGDGSSSSPWGSIQESADNWTGGAYNVVIIHCKGSETWSSAIDLSSAASAYGYELRGYETTINDGGKYTIDIDGNSWPSAGKQYWSFTDLHLKNTGTNAYFHNMSSGYFTYFYRCKFSDWNIGTGIDRVVGPDSDASFVFNCEFSDIDGVACGGPGRMFGNFFHNSGTREMTTCIDQSGGRAYNNVISVDGATTGIESERAASCWNNTVFSAGGTGTGIYMTKGMNVIQGNVIAGFSGVGGKGIELKSYGYDARRYCSSNSVYNCATAYDLNDSSLWMYIDIDNETLAATPFAESGSATTLSNVYEYFAPQDVGSVLTGGNFGAPRGAFGLNAAGSSGSSVFPAYPHQSGT